VANTIAELLVAWRNFRSDTVQVTKDIAKASRDVLREVSLDPLRNYSKSIKEKNALLSESYDTLGKRITELKAQMVENTDAGKLAVWTKNLELMKKAAANHPGNPDRVATGGGGGGGDKGKGIGGSILSAVGGLFGKINPGAIISSVVEAGAAQQKKNAPPPVAESKWVTPKPQVPDAGNFGLNLQPKEQDPGIVMDKWSKFNNQINDGIGNIGVAFMPVLNQLLDFALTLSDTLMPLIMQAVQPLVDILANLPIGTILTDILTVATTLISAIGPIIEQLKPLFDSIFAMLAPLITDISEFIVVLIEGLAPILAVVAHIVSAVLGPALVFVGKALGVVIDIVKWVAKIAMAILKPVFDFIALLMDGIMWLFGQSNDFSGKDTTGKFINPTEPKKDTKVTAASAGAQMDKGLVDATKTAMPSGISAGQNTHSKSAAKAGSDVTSGGPRVININGVKFAEKIELSVISAKEGINHLEAQLQEMFLRILNSGAVIQ
jgi:hypothetical protein